MPEPEEATDATEDSKTPEDKGRAAMVALCGCDVFTGAGRLDRHAVVIADGEVAAVLPEAQLPAGAVRQRLEGGLLAPGFIDLQVNGGGGVLFNDAPSAESIAAIGAAHRRFGTTGFLPTLISDRREAMAAAAEAVRQARADPAEDGARVLGLHLEGPFLNPLRRGVHDPAQVRPPTADDIAFLECLAADPALGRLLVTLAPEIVPPGTIARLSRAGAIVAAGHSAATFDQIGAALAEGLAGFTHLFNAMTPLGSREPGVVGAALTDLASWCGVIADGYHVHPASLRLAIAAKPRGRVVLVTDAMPPVGAAEPAFRLYGQPIGVTAGRCTTADGTLAGSALDMAAAVRNAVAWLGVTLEDALHMASTGPAAVLGLGTGLGRIAPGAVADLVWLDHAGQVGGTWVAGRSVAGTRGAPGLFGQFPPPA